MQLSNSSAFSRRWSTALRLLKSGKFKEILIRTYRIIKRRKSKLRSIGYEDWHEEWVEVSQKDSDRITELIDSLAFQPFFSLIYIVSATEPSGGSQDLINSIREQIYPNWKLNVISPFAKGNDADDDDRIKYINNVEPSDLELNEWISDLELNDWVVPLESNTQLNKAALFSVASSIVERPELSVIYSDHDHINHKGQLCDPYMKPSWNPDLFESINYLKPFIILNKNLWVEQIHSGEHLHDYLIQATRKIPANEILHLPQILASVYLGPLHCQIGNSSEHLLPKAIENKNAFPIKEPLVSLIIPTRDQGQLLETCINSIYEKTTYENFEIILVDHQSEEKQARRVIDSLEKKSNARIEKYSGDFNFSAMVNTGAEIAQGEIIVLLNNDTEIIEGNWLELLVTQVIRKEIGVCGALLLFKNRTIQHAGIHPSKNGLMIHGHKHEKENSFGYFGHLQTKHEVMAVTGACLSTKKTTWNELGGFNANNLKVAYNDVDFCLKAREAGLRILLEPKVKIIHHESASRGVEQEVFRNHRLQKEISYMKDRWGEFLFHDPASSPNLLLTEEGIFLNSDPKEIPVWKR